MLFAQDTSLSGQFAQQWKFWTMAQGAAPKDVANSQLRRLLARKKSFYWAVVQSRDSVLLYSAWNRKSAPRQGGPAKILDVDGTGARAKSQTCKAVRFCVRQREGAQNA